MEFVTVKEAMTLTGKSERTIRRTIEIALENPETAQYINKDSVNIRIDKAFLFAKYPIKKETVKNRQTDDGKEQRMRDMEKRIERLEKENDAKQRTIDRLLEQNDKLLDNLKLEQFKSLPEGERQKVLRALESRLNFDDFDESSEP